MYIGNNTHKGSVMKTMAQKSQTQLWNHLDKARMMANGSVDWDIKKNDEIDNLFVNMLKELETLIGVTAP
tara:strand:- start:622 stop:831 length:210 start_codon:yes stop_codon:yes gene_type:complete